MKIKLLFPLLLLFCKVRSIRQPHIDGEEEKVLEEGDDLILHCRGSKPMHWCRDHDECMESYTTNTRQNDAAFPFVSTLKIEELISLDTGYYYCHYNDSTDFKNDKERTDSVYVYVHGGNEIFVMHYLNPKQKEIGKTLHIECGVLHPLYSVTLKLDGKDITSEERVKFDPREGFTIEGVKMEDKGTYECESNDSTLIQKVEIISAKKTLPPPSINKGRNQLFVIGQKFLLECSVLDHENITFTWKYPNAGVKHKWKNDFEQWNSTKYYKSILEVSEPSTSDTGEYICNISSEGYLSNYSSINITLQENVTSFVDIISAEVIEAFEGQKDPAKWKTEVDVYPAPPKIIYTNWRGQVLNETDRITIEYDELEGLSWLRIEDISSTDFGNYTITVNTTDKDEKSKSATVTFAVYSAPLMMLDGVPNYVPEGQELNVTCRAQGFPHVNVSLLFQNCTKRSSCKSPTSIETVQMNEYAPGNIFEISAVFSPNTSGFLWCHGMNVNGSQNESLTIRMSDIDGIFVLRYYGPDKKSKDFDHEKIITVVENDNFTLMCGGTKFDYKKVEVTSSQQTGSQLQFQSSNSKFSWQKKKEVRKATKSLTGHYNCSAYPHEDRKPDVKSFNIIVVEEKPVVFEKQTNMNGQTEQVKDDVFYSLKCIVTGSPAPTIQWQKDNMDLTKNSEVFDKKVMNFSSDGKELKFKHVREKHTGLYTCIAKNRLNEERRSLTLAKPFPGLSKIGKLILIVLLVGLAILGIVTGCLIHRVRKEKKKNKPFRRHAKEFFEKGNIESLNLTSTADKQAEMLPYNKKKWEVPRANITFGKQLGSGAFGRVIKASVTGLQGPATTTVAIKMCKNDVNALQIDAIISELKIMMHLGAHLNIVNLLGANTELFSAGEIWILVEYCRFGNLLDFMQKHRRNFTNLICPETGKIDPNLIPNSPMSPTFSEGVSPSLGIDHDGYLAPTSTQFVLSDPPKVHSAGTVPSSITSTSPSSSFISQMAGGQFANNPLYSMNINTATENSKGESIGSEDFTGSKFLQRKASRLMSVGSITLSDGSSVSHPLRNRQSFTTPLSPTETYFMGETDPDILYEIGNVPGVTAPFSTTDLICWGWQMAQGMNYLSRRKILHGDLAARNLLLADNNVLKISDFGLSRNMYRNDNYVKKGDDLLPIKWMSIEAIRDKIFSIESDVWAFGITLWEIFSLGCSPYAGVEVSNDFLEKLENGQRMNCPKYGNEEIYKIMKLCWEEDPMERPSFSQLVDDLGNMISDHTQKYLSQNEVYIQMNTERFKEETDYLSMMAKPTFESRIMPDEIEVEHYLPMRDSTRNSSIRTEFPDTVVYSHAKSPQASSTASPIENSYLPMSAAKPQSPSDDVFSPHSSEPSRFTFPSSNTERPGLVSLPEEESSTSLEAEELKENAVLLDTRKQPPSDTNTSDEENEEKKCINNYVNL
ncbi:vascular endothelial growth factor receptor 2-like isoform X2 [Scylla paramamosain]|uniref:vascular endothelial growth factor receptor 2-like isoform X2 n=1 Tax=Scylla paramamosain TaxID=85552 RepID=UPI003082D71E